MLCLFREVVEISSQNNRFGAPGISVFDTKVTTQRDGRTDRKIDWQKT
jgi:hypothetical protein